MHERVQVAAVGREVVEPVGREPGEAEAAQVGGDHVEAGVGEGPTLRHQMRIVSGQPWISSSAGPVPVGRNACSKPRGDARSMR